jgi:hypothetical protein
MDSSARKVLHVVPDGGQWAVKVEGGSVTGTFDRKTEAEDAARESAKGAALGQVIVHGSDGTIEKEWTYGEDPRSKKG